MSYKGVSKTSDLMESAFSQVLYWDISLQEKPYKSLVSQPNDLLLGFGLPVKTKWKSIWMNLRKIVKIALLKAREGELEKCL